MTITRDLAAFALELRLDLLPSEVIETAKVRVLDTLGVALAGSREECVRIATEVALATGSTGRATTIASGHAMAPSQAALVNGVSAHALEFDDMSTSIISHTSATVGPAVLALAEDIGATGEQFLEAYIAGFEVTTRIGWSMGFALLKHGWHPNGVLAVIGSAAAAARLLGADVEQVCCAMGIAASTSAGLRKNVGSMTKPFHMGHAAANGILAAQLARRGYRADTNILERGTSSETRGSHAFFSFPEVFVGEADYDLSQITRNLGSEYELAGDSTITRFHPGSSFPQAAIDEIIELSASHDIDPASIERIRLGVTPLCRVIASYGPPQNAFDARFSLRFAVAVAAIDRRVTIREYTDDRVESADVQDMMRRLEVYVPDAFAAVTDRFTGTVPTPVSCIVDVILKDGTVISGRRDTTKGYPGAKAGWSDVLEKYNACASLALSDDRVRNSADLIRRVADLDSVSELTAALQPDAKHLDRRPAFT